MTTVYVTENLIVNLDNVVCIRKYTKYPKQGYDDPVEFLIGVTTKDEEWITIYRTSSESLRDMEFESLVIGLNR